MIKLEILWELPKCDTETQNEQMLSDKCHQLDTGLLQTFNLLKKKNGVHLWSTIKWRTISQGMLVLENSLLYWAKSVYLFIVFIAVDLSSFPCKWHDYLCLKMIILLLNTHMKWFPDEYAL